LSIKNSREISWFYSSDTYSKFKLQISADNNDNLYYYSAPSLHWWWW